MDNAPEFMSTDPSSTPGKKSASARRLFIKEMFMKNFKSYAGEHRVGPFHKSFSAVVGPNGSWKSNVIDAMLFFVFGKRAKQEMKPVGKTRVCCRCGMTYPRFMKVVKHEHECVVKKLKTPEVDRGGRHKNNKKKWGVKWK